MKRPEIDLENHAAVYDFYASRKPNRALATLGQAAMHALYRPNVHISIDTTIALNDVIDAKTPLVIAANHTHIFDPFTIAAGMREMPVLRDQTPKTAIVAKADLYRHFGARRMLDAFGAVPVFRPIDNPAATRRTMLEAGKELDTTIAQQLINGNNVAIFPEGRCNFTDPTKLQPLMGGMGRMVTLAAAEGPVAVLPLAIQYAENNRHLRGAEFVVGDLFMGNDLSARAITDRAAAELSDALAYAVAARANRAA